jgi:hypothetical protein
MAIQRNRQARRSYDDAEVTSLIARRGTGIIPVYGV